MSLTQQFLIISILPFSFLGMAVYLWRAAVPRRQVAINWTVTLVLAAVWSSNILRFYGGVAFSRALEFSWGVVGNYTLSLTALGLLWTTFSHLSIPRRHGQTAVIVSLLLWLAAIGLDPAIWRYEIPDFGLAGRTIRHFDIWAAVWITSWLLPVTAGWIMTQQVNVRFPNSLYRNQIHYWLLVLGLFFVGGGLASIRQPGQLVWQEVGLLFIILAAYSGTVSIAHAQLTDLQLAVRQILSRLSGTLILFGLTWAALRFIVLGVTNLPTDTNPNLILTLAAAAFAGLSMVLYRAVNWLTHRLFMPSLAKREMVMARYTTAVGNLPDPAQVGEVILGIIQSNLAVDDAWIFVAEEGVGGKLILRPLTSLNSAPPETTDFAADSPFVAHLRQNATPLVQYDIDVLSVFDRMAAAEKQRLGAWQRVLYTPLHAGDRLVGLLALGAKHTGESYERADFQWLETLATQISPLLAQALSLANLRQINDYVFEQNQKLARKRQQLTQLTDLYGQLIALITPDLRKPLAAIRRQLQQLEEGEASSQIPSETLTTLNQQVDELKGRIDDLIVLSTHVQARHEFDFQPVDLHEITLEALHDVRKMAKARQVQIKFEPNPLPLIVLGDPRQLQEAIHHILHNAIKFNRVGGAVEVGCDPVDGHMRLQVVDTGIGVSAERLQKIWNGFAQETLEDGRERAMGLTLTHYIVTAHGGYLEAESQLETGSVFSIFLPLMEA